MTLKFKFAFSFILSLVFKITLTFSEINNIDKIHYEQKLYDKIFHSHGYNNKLRPNATVYVKVNNNFTYVHYFGNKKLINFFLVCI